MREVGCWREMMFGLREDSCLRRDLVVVNSGLACVDGVIAVLAIWQVGFTF